MNLRLPDDISPAEASALVATVLGAQSHEFPASRQHLMGARFEAARPGQPRLTAGQRKLWSRLVEEEGWPINTALMRVRGLL